MNTAIFDSHAHYDMEHFDEDRKELLSSLPDNNISHVVNVGANLSGSKNGLLLADTYPHFYAAVGVHPEDADEITPEALGWLEEASKHPKCVAIGEIGLDYYHMDHEKEVQKYAFEQQMLLAKKLSLPIIIHSRDAANDTLELVKKHYPLGAAATHKAGVVHCFSYSTEVAMQYVELGFYIGIGGVVTFPNGRKLKEVVEALPLEHLVLETDCPYLSPAPNRGKRNSSLNLIYVAEEIAAIKQVSVETVCEITTANSKSLYGIKS